MAVPTAEELLALDLEDIVVALVFISFFFQRSCGFVEDRRLAISLTGRWLLFTLLQDF